MTARNGTAERIAAHVAEHPGCTRADLLAALGLDLHDAMPTYCAKAGMIFAAGPRGSQRYFPTAELAKARHGAIVAEVAARREAKKRDNWRKDNLRKRAQRHASGSRSRNTRPGNHAYHLPPGVKLAPGVKVTIAPPMRDRWAA